MPETLDERLKDLERRVRVLEGDFTPEPAPLAREEVLAARETFSLANHLAQKVNTNAAPSPVSSDVVSTEDAHA